MIISRTPFRVSFVGGGSDIPAFYRHHAGAVVTTAIDKYVYITVNKNFDPGIRLKYSEAEEVDSVHEIRHHLIRESLNHSGITGQIEITSLADIPVKGTGLGSSSSYLVGLLHALNAYRQTPVTAEQLAKNAAQIEMGNLARPIGKQDQYIAAYGGLNLIEFMPDDSVKVKAIRLGDDARKKLQNNLHLFYTGITRDATEILAVQNKNFETGQKSRQGMQRMVELAQQMAKDLQQGRVENFGQILDENWQLKKEMAHNISNAQIDAWYKTARRAGAVGGKILGAGGGGFLLFFIPPDRYPAVAAALHPLKELPFNFEPKGSIIFNMKTA